MGRLQNKSIELDTSGLTYFGVYDNPNIFLRRLMILLLKDISSLTFEAFRELLDKYTKHRKSIEYIGVEAFLDKHLGKYCPHCEQEIVE